MSIREALDKAEEHARHGRDQEAQALFAAVLRRFPGNKQAKKGMKALRRRTTPTLSRDDFDDVLRLCAQKRHEAALGHVRRLCRDHPNQPALLNLLGYVLTDMGRLEDALEPYGQAIALEPDFDEAMNNIASVYTRLQRYTEALAYYQDIVRRGQADADVYRNLAQALRKTDREDEAVEALQRAIKLQPLNAKTHVALGTLLIDRGDYSAALRTLESALAIDPDNGAARQMLQRARTGSGSAESEPAHAAPDPFDALAPNFENTLSDLKYTLPTVVSGLLEQQDGEDAWYPRALDLGCGTGLAGLQVRSYCEHLTGVDRSAPMLTQATHKAVYDELVCSDAQQFLASADGDFDLVVLTDLLPYIDDPTSFLVALRQRCAANARVILSAETQGDGDIQIGPARTAHDEQSLADAIDAAGFQHLAAQAIPLYSSGGSYREGTVVMLTPTDP